MKSPLCFSLLALCLGTQTQAAEPPKNPLWLQQMRKNLQLDDKQAEQIKQIHDTTQAERKALRERTEKSIEAVLTEQQRKKRQEFRRQRKQVQENAEAAEQTDSDSTAAHSEASEVPK